MASDEFNDGEVVEVEEEKGFEKVEDDLEEIETDETSDDDDEVAAEDEDE